MVSLQQTLVGTVLAKTGLDQIIFIFKRKRISVHKLSAFLHLALCKKKKVVHIEVLIFNFFPLMGTVLGILGATTEGGEHREVQSSISFLLLLDN